MFWFSRNRFGGSCCVLRQPWCLPRLLGGVALLGLGELLAVLLALPLGVACGVAGDLGRGERVLRRPTRFLGLGAGVGPPGEAVADRRLVALVGRQVVALAVDRIGEVPLLHVGAVVVVRVAV